MIAEYQQSVENPASFLLPVHERQHMRNSGYVRFPPAAYPLGSLEFFECAAVVAFPFKSRAEISVRYLVVRIEIKRLAQLSKGFVITPGEGIGISCVLAYGNRERIEFQSPAHFANGIIGALYSY